MINSFAATILVVAMMTGFGQPPEYHHGGATDAEGCHHNLNTRHCH